MPPGTYVQFIHSAKSINPEKLWIGHMIWAFASVFSTSQNKRAAVHPRGVNESSFWRLAFQNQSHFRTSLYFVRPPLSPSRLRKAVIFSDTSCPSPDPSVPSLCLYNDLEELFSHCLQYLLYQQLIGGCIAPNTLFLRSLPRSRHNAERVF